MVHPGEQFRRSGPIGCALLTKQAPLSEISDLRHWGISACLSYRTDWHPDTVYHGRQKSVLDPWRTRVPWRAREVIYVMGILGNRDWPLGLGGHAGSVHGHPLRQQHQESGNTDKGWWRVG
jgi:hypothetical protein